ncbi:MAG: hypothetical protein ABIE22_00695 [archaeon]
MSFDIPDSRIVSYFALTAFKNDMALTQSEGHMYVIGNDCYVQLDVKRGEISTVSRGNEVAYGDYNGRGRLDFTEDCLDTRECLGVIPASKEVLDEFIKDLGLVTALTGKVDLPYMGRARVRLMR